MTEAAAPVGGGDPGGLPEAAGRRFASGAWSSGQSVPDFATGLAMGLQPVGLVQGYAVMQWAWYSGGARAALMGNLPAAARGQYVEQWSCPHGFVGPDHRFVGLNLEQRWVEESWSTGFGLSCSRMVEEATALGAHGVVGVVDDMRHLAGSGAAEFRIQGTAVVVPGAEPPPRPFTTYLSGQRLAKLVEAGYVPVAVVATLSSVQMLGSCMTQYAMAGTGATLSGGLAGVRPIEQVGKAQRAARHLAREHARGQLDGDTLHGVSVEQFEHEMGEADLAIQCVIRGSRVRRFRKLGRVAPPEPVVRLDDANRSPTVGGRR